jgi:hypothetical protein
MTAAGKVLQGAAHGGGTVPFLHPSFLLHGRHMLPAGSWKVTTLTAPPHACCPPHPVAAAVIEAGQGMIATGRNNFAAKDCE